MPTHPAPCVKCTAMSGGAADYPWAHEPSAECDGCACPSDHHEYEAAVLCPVCLGRGSNCNGCRDDGWVSVKDAYFINVTLRR